MHAQHCSDVCAFISHSPVVILTSMNIINVQTAARRAIMARAREAAKKAMSDGYLHTFNRYYTTGLA